MQTPAQTLPLPLERAGAPSGPQAIAPSFQERCDDKSEIGRDAFPLYNVGGPIVVASVWLGFYVFAAIHSFIASGN